MERKPIAFMSYARRDDEYEQGRLTDFRKGLQDALVFCSGRDIDVFQDTEDIQFGQNIEERITQSLEEVMILIPIITPSYFQSEWCQQEFAWFRERERQLRRNDLILWIYYQQVPELDAALSNPQKASNPLIRELAQRKYINWRPLRDKGFTAKSREFRREVEYIADRIIDLLDEVSAPIEMSNSSTNNPHVAGQQMSFFNGVATFDGLVTLLQQRVIAITAVIVGAFILYNLIAAASESRQPSPSSSPAAIFSPSSPLSVSTIAFTSNRDGRQQIYLMNADGNNQRNISNNPLNCYSPEWSLDGHYLAFVVERDRHHNLYHMHPDGLDQRRFMGNSSHDTQPTWSFDRTRIAFTSSQYPYIDRDIYVINVNGDHLRNLTSNQANEYAPSWSPITDTLAFTSERDGKDNPEIFVINADGSDERNLSNHLSPDSDPAWSPDGKALAFVSERDGNKEIYVMNADGSYQRNLTRTPSSERDPTWSPDGRQIVFTSNRDGNDEIYVMNADGSNPRNLTNHPAADYSPAWWMPRRFTQQ